MGSEMNQPKRKGRGRPREGRKQIEAQVLPETHKAIMEKVDKTDPAKSTIGKVLDAQFAKKKPTRKKP